MEILRECLPNELEYVDENMTPTRNEKTVKKENAKPKSRKQQILRKGKTGVGKG